MRKYIFFGVVFSLVMIFSGFLCCESRENSSLKSRIRDLEVQLAESRQKVDTFIIRDSVPVWKERVVEIDKTDYKKLLADKELIKELRLKVSQIEAENQTLLNTRDTVVLTPENDSVLTYRDKWFSFSYDSKSRVLDCEVRDSLSTIIAKEYKHKFLWFRWGTKGYDVYIVSHNPKCKVEYNRFIKVRK